jgi:hypothetical protein
MFSAQIGDSNNHHSKEWHGHSAPIPFILEHFISRLSAEE